MQFRRIQFYAAALFLALAIPASASAETKSLTPRQAQAQARTRADEGMKLYEAGRFQEAYEKLRAAEEMHHAPMRLLYMARCQHNLGRLLEARALYEKLLAEKLPQNAPEALVDAYAEAKKELEIVTVRAPKVRLVLSGVSKEGVRVIVDGARVAVWSGEIALNPGKHTIEVTAANVRPMARTFTLSQGTTKTLTLVLRPRNEASTVPAGQRLRGTAG
jgi:tetratricopeptide (TPR) repeat protein